MQKRLMRCNCSARFRLMAVIVFRLQIGLSPHVVSMVDVLKRSAVPNNLLDAQKIKQSISSRVCGERKLHIAEIGSIEGRI